MRYAWFITYLTAASPQPASQKAMAGEPEAVASLRCSEYGYWNDFIPALDYSSGLDAYVDSIQALIDQGKLYSAWELYLPVRLKPCGSNALENLRAGISHIELRMLDVNPLAPDGIQKEDIDFLHYLLIMWAVQEVQDRRCFEADSFDADAQRRAVRNMQRAALLNADSIRIEDPKGRLLPVRTAALDLLDRMEAFYGSWQDSRILSLIRFERRKILHSGERYAEKVLCECGGFAHHGQVFSP